jgi:hypothetical protein
MGDAGAAATDPLKAEVASLFTDVHGARSWPMSRARCGAMTVGVPILAAAIFSVVMVVITGSEHAVSSDEALRLGILLAIGSFLVTGLLMFVEVGQVAVWGGGIAAGPDGLAIHFGRERFHVDWHEVQGADLIDVDPWWSTRTRSETFLEIRFVAGDHEWPRATVFWGSNERRLRIWPSLFPSTTPLIVAGINAALAEARERTREDEGGPARADPVTAR